MAARPLLIVMIVRDAGLRSALVARLSGNFDLLTASRWEGLADRRLIRWPAVLVTDEAPDAWEDHGFARVVVLSAPVAGSAPDARLIHISPEAAIDSLSQLFTGLIDLDQSAPPREA